MKSRSSVAWVPTADTRGLVPKSVQHAALARKSGPGLDYNVHLNQIAILPRKGCVFFEGTPFLKGKQHENHRLGGPKNIRHSALGRLKAVNKLGPSLCDSKADALRRNCQQ